MINKEIDRLFKPVLDRIEKVKNCKHFWPDKDGSAYYRCSKCGYLADGSKELDKLITIEKYKEKGLSQETINQLLKYL
jgi:rubrerythrin